MKNDDQEIPTKEFDKMQRGQKFVFVFIYMIILAQKLDSVKKLYHNSQITNL